MMAAVELSDWPLHPAPKPTFVVGYSMDYIGGGFKLWLNVGDCFAEMEFPQGIGPRYTDRCEAIRQVYAKGRELHAVDAVKKRLLS
jgi:hypothetical protein